MTALKPRNILAWLLGLALLAGSASARPPEGLVPTPPHAGANDLGSGVASFARSHLNQEVGNGECWTLAFQALDSAGAHLPGRDGYPTYVFGKKVELNRLQPGDVLQMENVRFDHRRNGFTSRMNFPHHTAIVESASGTSITILQQNYNGVRKVSRATLDLNDRTAGTITAYRPQPR